MDEDTEDTLTPEWSFDIHDAIERAKAEVETPAEEPDDAPDDVDDVGPDQDSFESDESGELTEDADPQAEADAEPSPDVETPEATEDVDEEAPPQQVDLRDARISKLEADLAESIQTNQRILDILAQQHQRLQAPPAAPKVDLPDDVIRMALFGGATEEDWNRLPPDQKRAARDMAQAYAEREIRYAKDPEARLKELRPLIQQEARALVAPYLQERETARAREVFTKHAGDLDATDRKRLQEIYSTIPLSQSPHFEDQAAAFELAAERVRVEKERRSLQESKVRVATRESQQKAARAASRKGSRKGSGNTPAPNVRPPMGEFESPLEYAERLRSGGFAP